MLKLGEVCSARDVPHIGVTLVAGCVDRAGPDTCNLFRRHDLSVGILQIIQMAPNIFSTTCRT